MAKKKGVNPYKARISNDFIFSRVMREYPDLCKELIERILNIKIDHIVEAGSQVSELSVERKSVCFDVYLQSTNEAICVEMQATSSKYLGKRIRFYHSRMDHRVLNKGEEYHSLIPSYVIFICTHDPFEKGLPVYTFESRCLERPDIEGFIDQKDVIVNTKGDTSFASPELSQLIEFIESGTPTSNDTLTVRLADAVDEINQNEREWVNEMCDMETTYRIYREEAIEDALAEGEAKGRAKGRAEGRAEAESDMLAQLKQLEESGASLSEALAALETH